MTSPEQATARIMALRRQIAFHDQLYFEEHAPVISDYAYDQLKRELSDLEAAFPTPAVPATEDHMASAASRGNALGPSHRVPMLSLDKAYSKQDWSRFHERAVTALTPEILHYIIEPKYDGVAVNLTYRDGQLVAAATRGNGFTGKQILDHVQTIPHLPRQLKATRNSGRHPREIEIRGEVYISLSDYAELNKERLSAGEQPYQSPRSVAAGALSRTDLKAVENTPLSVVVFGIGACDPPDALPLFQQALYERFAEWGLPVVHRYWLADSSEAAWATVQMLATERSKWDFPHDGVVVKVDSLRQQAALGADKSAPRWAIACKFAPAQAATILRGVDPQVGRTGVLTPVAVFDPVSLAGATIRRASLHNYQHVAALDLHLGDTIYIERAGEVVPQIAQVDEKHRLPTASRIIPPHACPACETPVVADGTYLRCPLRACPAQVQKRIEHFVGPDALNIFALNPSVIEALLSGGLITDFPDLFLLTAEDIPRMESLGISNPVALLHVISDRRSAPMSQYLVGIGIPGIGQVTAKRLALKGLELKAFLTLQQNDLEDFALPSSVSRNIERYFQAPEVRQAIQILIAAGVRPSAESGQRSSNALQGLTFAFSGTLESLTRQEATALVEASGGTVASSVTRSITHLICGNSPGRKLALARKLGIAVVDEEEFRRMLLPP